MSHFPLYTTELVVSLFTYLDDVAVERHKVHQGKRDDLPYLNGIRRESVITKGRED